MKSDPEKRSQTLLRLKPRYYGSYAAMTYGLATAILGHTRSNPLLSSVGELVFYGSLLYHARKRQRFKRNNTWIALEVYAGISFLWMTVNILKTQVWRWHPIAFGLTPLIVMGWYSTVLLGRTSYEEKSRGSLAPGTRPKQIVLMIAVTAVWIILNTYAFPKMHIMT